MTVVLICIRPQYPYNQTLKENPVRQLGNKIPVAIVLIMAIVVPLWAMHETPTSSASAKDAPVTTTSMQPKDNPYTAPEEPATPPSPDIRTIPVTGWGTKVVNDSQTLSLQARGTEPGDTSETVQVNFDLCALKDISISDTESMGGYDITVDTLMFPEDGLLDGKNPSGGYEKYSLTDVVIVDNTPMVNEVLTQNSKSEDPVYGEAGDLVSVLHKGTCTTASVEVKRADRNKLAFGFIYTTIPFGEFRVGGGVTQLSEQGPKTIRYVYENN